MTFTASNPLLFSIVVATVFAAPEFIRPVFAQACTPDLKADEVLGSDVDALAVGMRWCGLIGAPSVDDPSLVGESRLKDMLW